MKKNDKKLNNQIIKALNCVCEIAKHDVDGFKWISHKVNFRNFPDSLRVACSFENSQYIQNLGDKGGKGLRLLIQTSLKTEGILLKDINHQIHFDN